MTALTINPMPTRDWSIRPQAQKDDYEPLKLPHAVEFPEPTTLSAYTKGSPEIGSLDLQLFDNAAELKISMSRVAMYLLDIWRDSIRERINSLLAIEYWEEEQSSTIARTSFVGFLQFVTHVKARRLPSLGVSGQGHLLASWQKADKKVAFEFLTNGLAKAAVVKPTAQYSRGSGQRIHILAGKNCKSQDVH